MSEKMRHLERAEKALARGRVDAALDEFQAALRVDPEDQAVRRKTIDLFITAGRGSEAARLMAQLFEHEAASGEPSTAIATYRKLAKLTTPSADHQATFARLIEPTSISEAAEAYASASEQFRARGRAADAVNAAADVARLRPSAGTLRREAELAAEAGQRERAATAYARAAAMLNATDVESAVMLARAHELAPDDRAIAIAFARALVAQREFASALRVVESLADALEPSQVADVEEVRGEALFAVGRLLEAEPLVWRTVERRSDRAPLGYALLDALFAGGHVSAGLNFARRLQAQQAQMGHRRQFVARLKDIGEKHSPGLPFLEYLAEVFNSYSEADYSSTLLKLFELYYAAGNFLKAADCLDRAAEVDAYEPGHRQRLEMLRGKVDARHFNAVAHRLGVAPLGQTDDPAKLQDDGSTVLEDLALQAEIFLQYGMQARAVERLMRIRKLFPAEEHKTDKLRDLFIRAGIEAAPLPAPVASRAPSAPADVAATRHDDSGGVENIARITQMSRNIYRQGNVKSVLFTAVNEIGRHWNSSRCIAVLAAPGKPPSIALEYVAPGLKQSDVMAVVKMVALMQPLILAHGPLAIGAKPSPAAAPLKQFVDTLGIASMLAVPLVEDGTNIGLLILGETGQRREWGRVDIDVLQTVAEQVSLAVANAKLRSLVKNLAVTEERTGLLKRSSYVDMLVSEVRRAQTQRSEMSLMLANFGRASELLKEFGDTAVEQLMGDLGHLIVSHTRQHDLIFRYDKTTIALLLAETSEKNGIAVYEKLRTVISASRLPGSDEPPRMAAGVAEAVLSSGYDPVDVVTEAINRVEAALDAAIKSGPEGVKALSPVLGVSAA